MDWASEHPWPSSLRGWQMFPLSFSLSIHPQRFCLNFSAAGPISVPLGDSQLLPQQEPLRGDALRMGFQELGRSTRGGLGQNGGALLDPPRRLH